MLGSFFPGDIESMLESFREGLEVNNPVVNLCEINNTHFRYFFILFLFRAGVVKMTMNHENLRGKNIRTQYFLMNMLLNKTKKILIMRAN